MSTPPDLRNLSVIDARARMLATVAPLGAELVSLEGALGRTLAAALTARRDQPPFDASAMDGWAIRRADLRPGARLGIVGESAAGRPYPGQLGPRDAVRISTGAPVPSGADWVVIQENTQRQNDVVILGGGALGGPSHIRPRGGDLAEGAEVLSVGQTLNPWQIALAAAAGHNDLPVVRRPRVAVLVNGEELAAPGVAPGPWQIADSGGPGLSALISAWGAAPQRLPPARDSQTQITAVLRDVQADLIVIIGGASVGDHDLVKPALADLGLGLLVETINVRPGKPTWFGILADGRHVLGLPGNPASAFVCAQLFLQPLIRSMLGKAPDPDITAAVLSEGLPANGPREHWMRAAVMARPDGVLGIRPLGDQDSSLVSVFAEASALLRRAPDAAEAKIGQVVEALILSQPVQEPRICIRVQGGDVGESAC
jgi:molybdopterin molybdotransferase